MAFELSPAAPRGELIQGDRTVSRRRPGAHHTPALSASRLQLYRECPALYYRRYVLGIYDSPTIDMEYGQALHRGLETLFLGRDADLAFMQDLHARLAPLIQAGADPADWLVPHGIRLLEMVRRLGYRGQPERSFIFVEPGFRIPIRGILDLWMPDEGVVIDWKTTRHPWSDKTLERYLLQRAMYARAAFVEFHTHVTFKFGVLGAYPGGQLQVIDSTPTQSDIDAAFSKALEIHELIEVGQFDCTCGKHGELAA